VAGPGDKLDHGTVTTSVDKVALGAFLRARRDALRPGDVGLCPGTRRRTSGLRREEAAELCDMSTDYWARLERGTGPHPSEGILAAIARGLRLTLDERDHLFVLGGHRTARRALRGEHVNPGLMRVLDRLQDTPAQVMGSIGETLVQTPPLVALLGDQTGYAGLARSAVYRWFTDPGARERYLAEDHPLHSRINVAQLRASAARQGPASTAAGLVTTLTERSGEFAELWERQEVGPHWTDDTRFTHPELGLLHLHRQTLLDPAQDQSLLVFTATPGTDSHDKLALLTVLGAQQFTT
jgi:transcriptional regulator with XRE-family HTH domain